MVINVVSLWERCGCLSPSQPLSSLSLSFVLITPVLLNLDYISRVSPQHTLSLTQSLKEASDPKDRLAEKWKLEPRWWRTGWHRHQLERALQEKEQERPTSHVSGQEGEARGPGQTGQNILTCSGQLGSSGGPSPCLLLLLPQNTILPLSLQSPTLHLFRCNSAQRRKGEWRSFSEPWLA